MELPWLSRCSLGVATNCSVTTVFAVGSMFVLPRVADEGDPYTMLPFERSVTLHIVLWKSVRPPTRTLRRFIGFQNKHFETPSTCTLQQVYSGPTLQCR